MSTPTDRWVSQLRKGLVEYCVLMTLSRGESYGYGVLKELRRIEALSFSESTVYPVFTRLAAAGLLSSRLVRSDKGPPRRYYALTPAGRAQVAAMKVYWSEVLAGLEQLSEEP